MQIPPATPKSTRSAAQHPGVSIKQLEPHPRTGQARFRLRWRDPLTRRADERTLTGGTRADAELWAAGQSDRMRTARNRRDRDAIRAEIAGIDPHAPAAVRHSIANGCRAYYRGLAEAPNRSRSTLRHADRALLAFLAWCDQMQLVWLDQLTVDLLKAYRVALVTRTRPDGRAYKVSSINQALKPVRAMLNAEHESQHAPAMHSGATRVGLKHTPVKRARDKARYGIDGAWRLTVPEIRALLTAALRFDARERRPGDESSHPRTNVAIDVAMLLLTGLRLAEYTFSRCGEARRDKAEYAVIRVLDTHAKGSDPRTVNMRGFTLVGADLLLALIRDRAPGEWLSESRYSSLSDTLRRLHAYGAPKCSPHDLRATCATYQTAVKNLDSHRRVARLGHGIGEAHDVYIDAPEGMVFGAPTLEDAMGCRAEFRAVLAAYRAWPYRRARTESRPPVAASSSQALLSDSPTVLADAMRPHPAKLTARSAYPVAAAVVAS